VAVIGNLEKKTESSCRCDLVSTKKKSFIQGEGKGGMSQDVLAGKRGCSEKKMAAAVARKEGALVWGTRRSGGGGKRDNRALKSPGGGRGAFINSKRTLAGGKM